MTRVSLDWQIFVFCHNEDGRLASCLHSLAAASSSKRALITVLLNGSTDESRTVALAAMRDLAVPIEVFDIPFADKSNAINVFLHDTKVRREAELYLCVDGYATVDPAALAALQTGLDSHPVALAASGVAGNGRTSKAQTERAVASGGRLHGQLYAIRPAVVARIAAAGLRLPVGLYRGDGLLGSMLAHDLDAVATPWANERLLVVADAVFEIERLSPFRWRDLRRQFYRKIRQMRGILENAAIRDVIYRAGYGALQTTADEMIAAFMRANRRPAVAVTDRPFMALALRQIGRRRIAGLDARRVG